MNYQKIYDQLVERGKNRITGEFTENHHIVPSCQGGPDIPENMVRLTPEEHYVAHQLLVKIYPGHYGLIKGANVMCWDPHGHRVNNKIYGWLKRKHAEAQSIRMKGKTKENCESVAQMAETLTGRTALTHQYLMDKSIEMTGRTKEAYQYLQDMSDKRTGQTKENNEGIAKMADALRNRTKEEYQYLQDRSDLYSTWSKETHPHVAAQAESLTGRTKENYQYLQDASEKMLGRRKETHTGKASQAEALTGRTKEEYQYLQDMSDKRIGQTKENNEGIAKMAESLNRLTKELRTEVFNRRNNGDTFKKIHNWLTESGIEISYSALPRIYKREVNLNIGK